MLSTLLGLQTWHYGLSTELGYNTKWDRRPQSSASSVTLSLKASTVLLEMFASRTRRRLAAAALLSAASFATGVYLYVRWCKDEQEEEVSDSLQRQPARRSHDATSRALWEQNEADTNLQNHFQSIQRISDTTTLPQMLVELERGLDRAANVDLLISQLRQSNKLTGLGGQWRSKVELWQELKLVSWARTLSAAWLVALLDLLLRVQLNILGRHLFLQTHLLDSAQNGWMSQAPARKVTERAQEMFLEYAHYLPERATERIVAHMREAVSRELNDMDLSHPLDGPAVLAHASSIHSAFEEWALEKGWAQLVLPTRAEAAEYFAGFRAAPPDMGALRPEFLEVDEDVVQGMVDELHRVMQSARFSTAVLAAVQQAARQVADWIESEVGSSTYPLAKMVPKVTAAGNALLDVQSHQGGKWLGAVADLAQVKELCASVYSCGPPP